MITMAFPQIVQFERKFDYIWVTLPETLNVAINPKTEKEIIDQLQEQKLKVVINCCNIQYLYSAGIALMIRIRNHLLKNSGSLWLVNVSARCKENLVTLRLDTIFTIFSTDVEFELSQTELWEDTVSQKPHNFLCIPQVKNGVCHIALTGNMTVKNNLSSFHAGIYASDVSRYVFDLAGLELLDSYGVSLFLNFITTLEKNRTRYCAFGAKNSVHDLLTLIAGDKIITFLNDEKNALQFLNQ